eukprot:1093853-Amphidinium_carterae.2
MPALFGVPFVLIRLSNFHRLAAEADNPFASDSQHMDLEALDRQESVEWESKHVANARMVGTSHNTLHKCVSSANFLLATVILTAMQQMHE